VKELPILFSGAMIRALLAGTKTQTRRVLNHVPSGRVRNFWRPVADHLSGYECPCVADEPAIREDKGDYVWRGITR
jgi:hypothetical protein